MLFLLHHFKFSHIKLSPENLLFKTSICRREIISTMIADIRKKWQLFQLCKEFKTAKDVIKILQTFLKISKIIFLKVLKFLEFMEKN